MKTIMSLILVALFALAASDSAQAQKPAVVLDNESGWQKIGETVASFKEQDESIAVLGADEFAAIKIRVNDADLQIERLQVFYESGEMEEIDVAKKISAGTESEAFRLEHHDRDIQKVAFTYSTAPNAEGEKADIELFGLKSGREGDASEAYRDADDKTEDAGDEIRDEAAETEAEVEREAEEAEAETEEAAENTESDVERAAEETGDAISETAGKAAAEIDDRRHDTKVGPDGQAIYISDDERYYYVNEEGKRVYVSEWQLIDKPEDK